VYATAPATRTDAVLDAWALDAASLSDETPPPPECAWRESDTKYASPLCNAFTVARLASTVAARATERAVQCAARVDTECVLSPEIGLAVPAAFVYDHAEGMRMIVAPRIINGSDERGVRALDPTGERVGVETAYNHSIRVEYLPGGSRVPAIETLSGQDAYCVQLLREAFVPECWANLD
jgi:hypothetical protein